MTLPGRQCKLGLGVVLEAQAARVSEECAISTKDRLRLSSQETNSTAPIGGMSTERAERASATG